MDQLTDEKILKMFGDCGLASNDRRHRLLCLSDGELPETKDGPRRISVRLASITSLEEV
jgi:hypothetical protein